MAPTDYNIHDVQVRDAPRFGIGGAITQQTTVTFYIGDHGPFTLNYAQGTATSQQIRADMDSKVRDLRTITGEP